jgi:hypothetical protein
VQRLCEDCFLSPVDNAETDRERMGRWAANPQFAEQLRRIYEEWSGIFLSKKFDAAGFSVL